MGFLEDVLLFLLFCLGILLGLYWFVFFLLLFPVSVFLLLWLVYGVVFPSWVYWCAFLVSAGFYVFVVFLRFRRSSSSNS